MQQAVRASGQAIRASAPQCGAAHRSVTGRRCEFARSAARGDSISYGRARLPSGFEDIFRSQVLRRQAYAAPGAADPATFGWPELAEVLATPAPDVLVVARGERLELPPPKTLAELREYMRIGIGVAARSTERHHERLAAIARSFVAELGAAQVQLFATPGGTHGFGWHYDDEDVFILQTAGIKDYYFRANTVAGDVPAHGSAFGEYARETSPLQTARLVPGDFLYIPSRWWHVAVCEADALSISVGVRPRLQVDRGDRNSSRGA